MAMMSPRALPRKGSPLPKPDKRIQVHVPLTAPAAARHVPGATSRPTKNVPPKNIDVGDFSAERSWVHGGHPCDLKPLSVGAMVTIAGPSGYSAAMTSLDDAVKSRIRSQ